MRLTLRQKAFLDKLLDLYRETQQPIHYTKVAEKLGVGNTTAYEMLRLLEKKGYAASEYVLADRHSGPGRSAVVFYPTEKTRQAFRRLAGETAEHEEWEQVKRRVLSKLGQGEMKDNELFNELLAAIPQSVFPLPYCAKVMVALLLSLRRRVRSKLREHGLIRTMVGSDPSSQVGLGLLPGFALGLSFSEIANNPLLDKLIEYSKEYQSHLQTMDEERRENLADFLREVVEAF